jgi:hypothetical protein
MRETLEIAAAVGLVAVVALAWALSARAGERRGQDVVEASAPPTQEESAAIAELLQQLSAPRPPSPEDARLTASLAAIHPGGGLRLPAPVEADESTWQEVVVGRASMRVPADWTVQNDIGGADDRTIGLSPPAMDLYIELRQIHDADSNYLQTVADHARSEYSRSVDRLAEGVILGFEPRAIDGAIGGVEVMNQFGMAVDEETGQPTFRLVLWRARWEQDGAIQRAEFQATLAQDRYGEFAPLIARVLATVRVGRPAEASP